MHENRVRSFGGLVSVPWLFVTYLFIICYEVKRVSVKMVFSHNALRNSLVNGGFSARITHARRGSEGTWNCIAKLPLIVCEMCLVYTWRWFRYGSLFIAC